MGKISKYLWVPSFILFFSIGKTQTLPLAFWKHSTTGSQVNCETGTPSIGDICIGGAIYAGKFPNTGSVKYMVLPGGCDGTTTDPVCSGTDNASTKMTWAVSSSGAVTGIETIPNVPTASAQYGDFNQAKIMAYIISSGKAHNAAKYCDDLVFGGYSDWYLPAKTELAYIYCKATVGSHSITNPAEGPNCVTTLGGKSSQLKSFDTAGNYWSSSEFSGNANAAWMMSFNNGFQSTIGKSSSQYVRCIRRF